MDALTVRAILNGILMFGFLVGAISLFLQRKNGITRAMAIFTLLAALHVGQLVLYGLIDANDDANAHVVDILRISWNIVSFLWILSGCYLAYVLVKGKDDE